MHNSETSSPSTQTSLSDIGDQAPGGLPPVSELDGDDDDPIVICGFAIKFPQEATSPEALWKMMMERRCAMTDFPAERVNADGFYQKKSRLNTVSNASQFFTQQERCGKAKQNHVTATAQGWSFHQGGLVPF